MGSYAALARKTLELAKMTVRMTTEAGSGHPSSSLSIAHIVTALMYRVMRYDAADPWHPGADRLILSEGHAVPIVYAAYCDLGGVAGTPSDPIRLSAADGMTLREADSVLDGHPNPAVGFPFFDSATGSLGQGASAAAGLACAARLDGCDRRFFVIIGDGEAREGQICEALDFIIDQKLAAVRCIFNCNGHSQSEYVSPLQSAAGLAAKLIAKGFDIRRIDGHDLQQVVDALEAEATGAPIAVVAETVKGWGSTELQSANYHGKPLTPDQLGETLAEMDAAIDALGVEQVGISPPPAPPCTRDLPRDEIRAGSFAEAVDAAGMAAKLSAGKLATRRAYGAALLAMGADERIVATDGDVKNSTFVEEFAKAWPDRFFEARIAEQNMVSMAVGLAAGGKIPFASTFSKFMSRPVDQIEMAAITNANIKLVGSHSGISLAADGPSQMGLLDLAFFRALAHARRVDGGPACRVFQPADAVAAFRLTELMANIDGMCYMRTHRPDVEIIYDEDEAFVPGGHKLLVDGSDVAIVTSGYMVHVVREAVGLMASDGLEPSVVDVYGLPLADPAEVLQIGDDCNGQILVVEDNFAGGIADEISAVAAASDLGVTVHRMILAAAPKSCRTPPEILAASGLSARHIAERCQAIFDSVR